MAANLDNPELKCRGGCGFYGNPNWEGYCSICKKKLTPNISSPLTEEVGLSDRLRAPSFTVKPQASPPASPLLGRAESSRFLRETSAVAATLKKAISQAGDSSTLSSQQSLSEPRSSPTPGKPKSTDRFSTILRTLPRPVSTELETTVKHFLHKLHARTFVNIDELSEFVQKFYVKLEEKLNKNNVYLALPSQVRDDLWDEVEAHICQRLHKTVFAHLQDEDADLALHNKLRSLLKEIKPVDLELPQAFADSDNPQNEEDSNMQHLLDDAFLAIIDMTTKTTPQEILACLSTCCSALFSALRAALPSPPSADDFLPALIYCVIRTNPPQIHSTIAYVERFALPRRILDGEPAYYFTNLCCAVRYLDSTDAAAIKEKSKKVSAAEEADTKEAAEKGCTVAALKAGRRISFVEAKLGEELPKRLDELDTKVSQTTEIIEKSVRKLDQDIKDAVEEADKAIETQLIDFNEPSPTEIKLFVLGTMDAEAVEQLKSKLVKSNDKQDETINNQPPLIDFEAELPTPASSSS